MIPPQGACSIAVINTESVSQTKLISSKISRSKYPVSLPQPVTCLCVDVVEIQSVPVKRCVFTKFQKCISVCSASSNDKRTFIGHNGPFNIKPRGYQTNTTSYRISFIITIFHFQIKYR